jgi:hypothetical protein
MNHVVRAIAVVMAFTFAITANAQTLDLPLSGWYVSVV